MKIALAQLNYRIGDFDKNLQKMKIAVHRASEPNVVAVTSKSMTWLVKQLNLNTFELPFETKPILFEMTYHKKYKNDQLFKQVINDIKHRLRNH